MVDDDVRATLLLPALRAKIGDWIYFLAAMRMDEIAQRVSVASEIHKAEALNELIQREVDTSGHSKQISRYLQTQPQRFFNSLVLGVYGGEPKWFELGIERNESFDPEDLSLSDRGLMGVLQLTGSEKIFAIDGQHRVVGIKEALKEPTPLSGEEEVPVVFVSHQNSPAGMERTRRLFSTLNRYARPVSKGEIIALDEDDVVAIVTRRLVNDHVLLQDRVSSLKSKNIPPTDQTSFTSIVSIYDALDVYLRQGSRGWKLFKTRRPTESRIEDFSIKAYALLDQLMESFPVLRSLVGSPGHSSSVVMNHRNSSGGHLIFRPIGFEAIVFAIRELMNDGRTLEGASDCVAQQPMELGSHPWELLLWNPANKTVLTEQPRQRVAGLLLFHRCGGNLARLKLSEEELTKRYKDITMPIE